MPDTKANAATRQRPRQFSLLNLLLVVLVVCIAAAYWGQRRITRHFERQFLEARQRAMLAEERLAREENQINLFLEGEGPRKAPGSNRRHVHIESRQSAVASRDRPDLAWSWNVYLPSRHPWGLYTSHGEDWDEHEIRYSDGAISGCQIEDGVLGITVIVTRDLAGEPWLIVWAGNRQHYARLPPEWTALLDATGETQTIVTGETVLESIDPDTADKGRIVLLRWHKRIEDDALDATSPSAEPIRQAGFSLYLVDESPRLPARAPARKPAANNPSQK